MNISFDLYKIYYYVCKFRSITIAANFLHVTQPAITRHIKNLETYIGKTLIIRGPKGIELTSDGENLYNQIKESVEVLNGVETNINNSEEVIRIIAGYSTIKKFLFKVLVEFNKKYPKVKFEILTYNYDEAMQRLRDGRADMIFLNMKESPKNMNDIIVNSCYELHDIFVVSKDYKGEIPKEIKLLDLNKYPLICKFGNSLSKNFIESHFVENGLTLEPTYELSNNWIIEEYVKLGVGIGILTEEYVQKELENKELIKVKTDIELPTREIGYAIRKNCASYNIIKEFVKEFVDNSLKKC